MSTVRASAAGCFGFQNEYSDAVWLQLRLYYKDFAEAKPCSPNKT